MNLTGFAIRYGFLLLLLGLVLLFSIVAEGLALGVTATLVVDGFDLSIGSVATSALMLSAYVMVVLEMSAFAAIISCLIMGALVGLVNGLLIVKARVPDLLATLGMMFLLIGLQRIPTEGRSISTGMKLPSGETTEGVFLENLIPIPVIIFILVGIVIWLFLELTRHGRLMYAIGSNETATALAGANVNKYKILAYVISGITASIGGILLSARLGRGDIASGNNLLLDSVAAALIGFAVLGAAKPNAFGTAIGALFVGVLLQGLTMMNAPYYTQDFVKGSVLVIALIFTFALSSKGRKTGH